MVTYIYILGVAHYRINEDIHTCQSTSSVHTTRLLNEVDNYW